MTAPAEASLPGWAPGPMQPRLVDGAVDVWRADLEAVSDALCELLCEEERMRAERLLHDRDRRRWTRSRGVLRALLGRYLQSDPSTLRFATGARGKPALAFDAARPPAFNLAHSDGLALYAFTAQGAVGIDVEVARRPLNDVAVAARLLGAAEARRLQELDPATREREFLRLWVRHEAELKLRGRGIAGTGTGIAAGVLRAGGRMPWIAELDVGSRAAGAVALEQPARELRCWDWRG
jgi:4'-phosphopantetheinyl transferase